MKERERKSILANTDGDGNNVPDKTDKGNASSQERRKGKLHPKQETYNRLQYIR